MKVSEKKQIVKHSILILVLCHFILGKESTEKQSSGYKTSCNQELVRSFGMIGRKLPTATPMEMCPSVKQSCCIKKDQLMIFNNWVSMKEAEYVTRLFDHILLKYTHFLSTLEEAEQLVMATLKRLQNRKISNCKVLAKRILHFEISALVPTIRKNVKKMGVFLETSYRGVYCSVCDHSSHTFIDEKSKVISYCDSFCRELLEAGLPYLLFFHVDIVKFVNLVTKFIVSCDYKGDYDTEALIPKKMIFFEDEVERSRLEECRKYRNKKGWMGYCSHVCEQFNIATVNPYFFPHLDLVEAYTPWLKKELDYKKVEHKHHPLFEEHERDRLGASDAALLPKDITLFKTGGNQASRILGRAGRNTPNHRSNSGFRILELKKSTKTSKKEKEEKEIKNRKTIFISKINSKFQLETYTTKFSGTGICLYERGLSSLVNESVYNEIKMIYHLSKMKKAPSGLIHLMKTAIGIDGVSSDERKEIKKLNSNSTLFMKSIGYLQFLKSISILLFCFFGIKIN